ncbi:MAG: twin-arginine translocase TatA/TatE family subunit [Desulfitobacteriaceae bacterium]|nr:twin-arginine translocase TatA/TatE family subunit [Desulfitobacteriaceae bacterium]MDI6912791.1 twin-arginine translocase TatA/TatE family subunit [Desulfitobacteriaceae bacterium]
MNFSEIVLLMAIALILFGPEDLPDIARAVGKIVYEIRKATSELTDGFKDIVDSPMHTLNKAFEETTQRTAVEKADTPDSEQHDLITYDGKPATEVSSPAAAENAENVAQEDSQIEGPSGREDDPLAELPPGMVTYEEKGASR